MWTIYIVFEMLIIFNDVQKCKQCIIFFICSPSKAVFVAKACKQPFVRSYLFFMAEHVKLKKWNHSVMALASSKYDTVKRLLTQEIGTVQHTPKMNWKRTYVPDYTRTWEALELQNPVGVAGQAENGVTFATAEA